MKPAEATFEEANSNLAAACQACASSCCKKGLLFLLPEEKDQIEEWIRAKSPNELDSFRTKLEDCGDFFLFDQEDSCQFLDDRNLCRLHVDGVKPTECFIWPAHVYVGNLGDLEVRISNSCCEGFKYISVGHPAIDSAESLARRAGYERMLAFRAKYGGSYGHLPTRVIDIGSPNVRFLGEQELGRYREKGERLFPNEDWDAGTARLQRMLARYPQGLAVYELDGEIEGYATLWPLSTAAAADLESGALLDSDVDVVHLDPDSVSPPKPWLLGSFAVMEKRNPQRRIALLSLLRSVSSRLLPHDIEHCVLAHGATEAGRRFLGRTGFTQKADSSEVPWSLIVPSKPY